MGAAGVADVGVGGFAVSVAVAEAFTLEGFGFFGPVGEDPDLAAVVVVAAGGVAAALASHFRHPLCWRQQVCAKSVEQLYRRR